MKPWSCLLVIQDGYMKPSLSYRRKQLYPYYPELRTLRGEDSQNLEWRRGFSFFTEQLALDLKETKMSMSTTKDRET